MSATLCLLQGCSLLQQDRLESSAQRKLQRADTSLSAQCDIFFRELDSAIRDETHFDPALKRVPNYPTLRVNRFLASYEFNSLSPEAKSAWIELAKALGQEAYQTEIQRLSDSTQLQLQIKANTGSANLQENLNTCYELQPEPEQLLPASYAVPDSYSIAQRFFGFYALVSHLAKPSIEEYRSDMIDRYTHKRSEAFHSQVDYRASLNELPSAQPPMSQNALGIPQISAALQSTLFQLHAPAISLLVASNDDAIGSPEWNEQDLGEAKLGINTQTPKVYTYTSYTRHKNQVLLQLNYAFWFPARTALKDSDIYAGELDGIIWRVTLDQNLRPVLFDSIHLCGCYHKLYLPPRSSIALDRVAGEQPLAFEIRPSTNPSSNHTSARSLGQIPMRITISAAEHYIIDVSYHENFLPTNSPAAEAIRSQKLYQLEPFTGLRLLANKDIKKSPKSMFGESGIIAQSNRTERYILWPLGVPAAGSMRAPGTHAIAFIGKRHFDDADLLTTLGFDYEAID